MGFNPLDILKYAGLLKYIPDVIKAIMAVEDLFKKPDPGMPKPEWDKLRQDAAVATALKWLGLAEEVIKRDLLNNAVFESLLRQLINTLIAIDNMVRDARNLRPVPPAA